MGELTEAIGS